MEEIIITSLAEDALSKGDLKVATDYFSQLTRDHQDKNQYQTRLAECHYRNSRWDDCLASARLSEDQLDSKFLRCLALHKKGDPHSAWRVWVSIAEQSASSQYIREQMTLELPILTNSVQNVAPTIPIEVRTDVDLLKTMGNGKFKSGKFSEAIKQYDKGLAKLVECEKEFQELQEIMYEVQVKSQFDKLKGVLLSNIINCEIKVGDVSSALSHAKECIEAQPDWSKAHFWLAVCYMYNNMYKESKTQFKKCSELYPTTEAQVRDKLDYLKFFKFHTTKLSRVPHSQWCGIRDVVMSSMEWLSGRAFAKTITQLYQESAGSYSMACGILVDKKGEITDVTAPKYETGEREKKLIEKMKSGERTKVYVHVCQCKVTASTTQYKQTYGFSQTEKLSSDQQLKLDFLTDQVNSHQMFNIHIQDYLP